MEAFLEGLANFAFDVGVLALIVGFGAAAVYGFERAVDQSHKAHRRRRV
jgi:hypothetical protein